VICMQARETVADDREELEEAKKQLEGLRSAQGWVSSTGVLPLHMSEQMTHMM
jgi:hypothetical protein